MKTNFVNRPKINSELYDLEKKLGDLIQWNREHEKELRERAIRLLQCRAGGRLSMFEAGLLYQICLELGMKDERKGKIMEQEEYWNEVVLSCRTELEAKQTLEKLLKNERVQPRKERVSPKDSPQP